MNTYTFKHQGGRLVTVEGDRALDRLIDVFGGGHTVSQTTKAMLAHSQLLDGKTVKHGGWTITRECW